MTLEALNSADVALVSWTKRRRSKRELDDVYFASCLIALSQSGGGGAAVDAMSQTNLSSSTATIIIPYNCTLCGHDFSSSRALSRHKASHRSKPPSAAGETMPSKSTSTADSDSTFGSHRLHKCLNCGDIFPTGQALGGHKRKHYGGVIGGGRKSRVTSSDGGIDVTSFYNGSGAVGKASIARNLELKLPLPPSPYLDLTLKL